MSLGGSLRLSFPLTPLRPLGVSIYSPGRSCCYSRSCISQALLDSELYAHRSYCPQVSPRGLEAQASVHPGVPRGSERDLLQPSRPRQKPWGCAGSPPALTLQVGLMTKSYTVLSLTMSRTCHFSPTLAQLSLRLMTASSGSLNSFPHVRSCHRGPSSERQKSHQPPDPGPPVSPQARHTRWPPPSGLRSAWGGDSSSTPTSASLHAALSGLRVVSRTRRALSGCHILTG